MSWELDPTAFNAGLASCGILMSLALALYPWIRSNGRQGPLMSLRLRRRADGGEDRPVRGLWEDPAIPYLGLCLSSALFAVSDLTSWVFPLPLDRTAACVTFLGNFGFNALSVVMLALFNAYVRAVLASHAVDRGRPAVYPASRLMKVLVIVYLAGCVISLRTHWFFSVSLTTRFHRGEFFWLVQVLMAALYLLTFVSIFCNRRLFERGELVALVGYVALPAAAELVQALAFGFAIVDVAVPIAIALLFMGVQERHEQRLRRLDFEVTRRRLELAEEQLEPGELLARADALTELCGRDPEAAARGVGEFAQWLRRHPEAFRERGV